MTVIEVILGILEIFIIIALCAIAIPYTDADILYRKKKMEVFSRMLDTQIALPEEDHELKTDTERLKDLYDSLHDLIECCMEIKDTMKDMDNWATAHDLEFQLELTAEGLRRYLADEGVKE